MRIGKRRISFTKLSDDETMVIVVSPTMEQFAEYITSLQVVTKIGEVFQPFINSTQGISVPYQAMAKLDQNMLNDFYPLISALSRVTTKGTVGENLENLTGDVLKQMQPMSLADFKELDPADGLPIIMCYIQLLAPESLVNPTPAEAVTLPQEQPISTI